MGKYAIIGFGNAGINCLKAIREIGSDAQVMVYAGEASASASNPMLTTYYSGGKTDYDGMFPHGSAAEICERFKANLNYETVVDLKSATRELVLSNGERAFFDKILIATGASPFIPIKGHVDPKKIFVMRTPADAEKLKFHLDPIPKTAIVAGGSMVGIKVCEVLNDAGSKVVLTDMENRIFPLAAFPCVSDAVMNKLKEKGIALKFGSALLSVANIEEGVRATFADESTSVVDMVVICVGVTANIKFVGDEVENDRGILVKDTMETSAPGIYAAGDCVRMRGDKSIIGLWANAAYQGQTAGYNMAGKEAHYSGNIPHNITHFMNMDFIGIGDPVQDGEIIDFGVQNCSTMYKALVKDGEVKCVNVLGNVNGSGPLRNFFTARLRGENTELTPEMKGLLAFQGVNDNFIQLLERK